MAEGLEALLLGIIQGLTEFLPISSSGHLELTKFILGYEAAASDSLLLTVLLHGATALATIFVFRKDIQELFEGLLRKPMNDAWRYSLRIVISMVPAALIGLTLDDLIASLFDNQITLVCLMLMVTGLLLFLADRAKKTDRPVSNIDAVVIGVAQAIAILPGISRSGATIATSVLLGNDRQSAARFSFLMVVPLILGKMAKDGIDGAFIQSQLSLSSMVIGFAAAFITGVLACKWMLVLVRQAKLKYFAIYCFVVAISVLIYLWLS